MNGWQRGLMSAALLFTCVWAMEWPSLPWVSAADDLVRLPPIPVKLGEDSTDALRLAVGGKLYDNWFRMLKKDPPKGNHPAYPPQGRQKGAVTWRCKECHGWDYMGADGQYGSGEHATGIKGIRTWQGRDPGEVVKILRGPTHQYTPDRIPENYLELVAMFVVNGQVETATLIDPVTGIPLGDPKRGASYFQTICANCHGLDGRNINFGTPREPEYLGSVAREDALEMLHKIRHGQPDEPMVALITLPSQTHADIIAYIRTLPDS